MESGFAAEFLRRVDAEFAAAGDFARRMVEHVGRAFGEEALALRVGIGAAGSAGVPPAGFGVSPKPFLCAWDSVGERRNNTSLVLCTSMSSSTTLMYLVNIICPMHQRPCMFLLGSIQVPGAP